MDFLLARGDGARRESRRTAIGLAALGVLMVFVLNAGIYRSARTRLVEERWMQLGAESIERRREISTLTREFETHARYVADLPLFSRWVMSRGGASREDVARELERTRAAFDFQAMAIHGADGERLIGTSDAPATPRTISMVRRALTAGGHTEIEADMGSNGVPVLALTVPMTANGVPVRAAMTIEMPVEREFAPLLTQEQQGSLAGAYLVALDGEGVVFLTNAPGKGPIAGTRAHLDDPTARAAAMAASAVESRAEFEDGLHVSQAAVTRWIPELGWGLVVQAEGRAMSAGMRGTLMGLLLLDLAMGGLAFAALWFWRRQYQASLARREMEITRRHADRIQAVLDTAFDAILTFDHRGVVRTANRAAESLLGRTAGELAGTALQNHVHWGDGGELPSPGTVTLAHVPHPDGRRIPAELSIGISGEGHDLLYTAIARDVSQRVEAERKIREFAGGLEVSNRRLEEANAQLEEASRLKTEFLANTSHELRTPLNGMIGFLQLVLDGTCDSKEEEREFLRQALQCSRHLLGLINDVLDIAKIEAGKLTIESEKVDVQTVFDEVYTLTHVQAGQKGIALVIDAPDVPLAVRGDAGKIKQILVNLVGNSLKFTPRGSITVTASPHPARGHILFEVTDTGIGIPPDRQKVIFDKFTQADGSTTRKYGGTGLGLAISRSLVELMGGIIGVHSEGEGRGTRLYFALPVWRDPAGETRETVSDRIAGPAGGPLVLVVEDDPVFRVYATTMLQRQGFRTVEAVDAETAWMLARRLRPAVAVLDYALTCAHEATLRSGWDLAERMAGDPDTRHIPIVFVTGFDGELVDKLRASAFARRPEHMVKPVEGRALVGRIEALVGAIEGRTVRVLMADDDPSVAAFVTKVLPPSRYHVEIVRNGEECLHALRTQPRGFDLLLLDLMMPEVSGYDVLREMALSGLAPDLPVVVLTNYPEPQDAEQKRLLEQGLVVEVVPKTAVHDNPRLLAHVLRWHLKSDDGWTFDSPSDQREVA